MGARKKSPGAAEFTVVLEDLRAQFRGFGEALAGFREESERRFTGIEGDIRGMRGELDDVRGDIRGMRAELDGVHGELALVKVAVLENRREIRDLRGIVTRIEKTLDRKVDRDEIEGIVAKALNDRT